MAPSWCFAWPACWWPQPWPWVSVPDPGGVSAIELQKHTPRARQAQAFLLCLSMMESEARSKQTYRGKRGMSLSWLGGCFEWLPHGISKPPGDRHQRLWLQGSRKKTGLFWWRPGWTRPWSHTVAKACHCAHTLKESREGGTERSGAGCTDLNLARLACAFWVTAPVALGFPDDLTSLGAGMQAMAMSDAERGPELAKLGQRCCNRLRIASPFFPGILLSRKTTKNPGKTAGF